MSWAALTSGGKDSILSCQKAIDSGKGVRYMLTARPKNRDSYRFLAGEGEEYESLTLNASFYSRPITYLSSKIRSTTDRHELVLGGFS